jgi:transposase
LSAVRAVGDAREITALSWAMMLTSSARIWKARRHRHDPDQRNRLIQLPVDAAIYALRNMVERCFNKIKNARRLATRYDKTADSYLGFIHIVSIRLWTRQFVNAS